MKKIDRLIGYIVFGFIIFITCFCIGWWLFYICGYNIIAGSIIGMIIGILLDILFLRILVKRMYNLPYWFLILVYSMYSFGVFGFFMGVPVFNIFVGIIAGWYIGRRMKFNNISTEKFKTYLRGLSILNFIVLLFICISSATLALSDPYTGSNIKGMLGLSFEINNSMIWGIILIGGLSILIIQHILTNITTITAYKKIGTI